MKPYALIDLHCDTLTDCKYSSGLGTDTLDDPQRVLSLSSIPEGVHWAQFYAIFIPDECRGEDAIRYYEANRDNFIRQMDKFSDRVKRCRTWVRLLAEDGVKAITLTWNGENEIGSGHVSEHGLTDFGKKLIPELEKYNILADVSHLNDAGFADLLEVAQKPFTATHSNARSVAPHKRNLTDDMIREMVRRECLIGLNYFVAFLREDRNVESLDDLYRHVDHFLSLGAERCLALGSVFDGAQLPECLDSPTKAAGIYEYLLSRNIPESTASGILYQNALDFFHRNSL